MDQSFLNQPFFIALLSLIAGAIPAVIALRLSGRANKVAELAAIEARNAAAAAQQTSVLALALEGQEKLIRNLQQELERERTKNDWHEKRIAALERQIDDLEKQLKRLSS